MKPDEVYLRRIKMHNETYGGCEQWHMMN
jgi:hypothetical protein